jgi:hypothetical protein
MATKTWKLGEVCKGGVITVETTKTQVKIETHKKIKHKFVNVK